MRAPEVEILLHDSGGACRRSRSGACPFFLCRVGAQCELARFLVWCAGVRAVGSGPKCLLHDPDRRAPPHLLLARPPVQWHAIAQSELLGFLIFALLHSVARRVEMDSTLHIRGGPTLPLQPVTLDLLTVCHFVTRCQPSSVQLIEENSMND